MRRKWALGGSQHGNLDEAAVETSEGSATAGDAMQVNLLTSPDGLVHLFIYFIATLWLTS